MACRLPGQTPQLTSTQLIMHWLNNAAHALVAGPEQVGDCLQHTPLHLVLTCDLVSICTGIGVHAPQALVVGLEQLDPSF